MPITVIAKLKVKPGSEAVFEAAGKEMIATVKTSEPGTLAYVLHKNTKDPTEFTSTRFTRIRLRSIPTARPTT